MPVEVVMPRLGWNMEAGSVCQWLKKDGDQVEEGDILLTVEGDKAIQEVEALGNGVLRIPADSPSPGGQVPVGTILAYLLKPGETLPEPSNASIQPEPSTPAASAHAVPASARTGTLADGPSISPRARRVARELGIDWSTLKGSGRSGRIVERDVRQATSSIARVSPLAKRVAADLGVDVSQLASQWPGRRVTRADVESAASEAKPRGGATTAITPSTAVGSPMTQLRRTIADHMAASAHATASVTLTTEADATELVHMRQQLKDLGAGLVPSFTALFTKLVAQALSEYPQLNAQLQGGSIVRQPGVHMGIAVDTERGLLVPVLRDVQTKSLLQIAQESSRLIEHTRSGHATPDEFHGSTFTITNLGMYEIDAFTPIINLPECAILGIGRIVPKQVVADSVTGQLAIRDMVFLSLTFDHRLVDGAPAARFLQRVKLFVEKPYLWLAA